MSKYIISPRAINDIVETAQYIAQDNLEVGRHYLAMASKTFEMLALSPKIGQIYEGSELKRKSLIRHFRVLDFSKYLVFYAIKNRQVEVIRVVHEARNIKNVL